MRLSAQHLAVVALLVATALCVAAWWALSARPQAETMPEMTTGAPVAAPTSAAAPEASPAPEVDAGDPTSEAAAGSEQVVVVDVAGRVRRPGIVTLPLGSRVADALREAGGARSGVDVSTLNLARVLVDGEQLLVGVEAALPPPAQAATPPVTGTPSAGVSGALVDLNTATEADLDTLPGVGPVTARAILDWRTEHGGFTSVDELLEVSGIGEVTLEELRPLVTV
jgi:competence protein ComEA